MNEIKTLNLPSAIKYFSDDSIKTIWIGAYLYQDVEKTLLKIDREYLLGYLKGDQEMSRALLNHHIIKVYRENDNVYIK